MITPRTARLLLLGWVVILLAVLVPWGDITDHTHWTKVIWIPFGPPFRPFDIVGNVLAFVPFGALWQRSRFRQRWLGGATAVAAGSALSFCAEVVQLYSHSRFPSSTDVITNAVGIVVGLWVFSSEF